MTDDELEEEIGRLDLERQELIRRADELHGRFMASPKNSPEEQWLADELDKIDRRLDQISDETGRLQNRLYEIESARSRRESLRDAAYGRMP